ncbi:sulfurtransferase complex subunit TusB [Candidatus Erwinia haradaeae]|uniref:Protein TusB n=1 Tax=Candidatus Erwinia haradaeae TaxID=1922217 RepID=A0A451D3Y5_9GAMM|nr:sulfurtransferase complex subunit TusB [Candidatus Erwinia haradaeae]VFP80382.1 Protein TusB [Candidatus Erwinia haradaeae]
MLHTISRSPSYCDFPAILRLISAGDDVLLLEDGVLSGMQGSDTLQELLSMKITLYILREDLIARGLLIYISSRARVVNYDGFIQLRIKNLQQIAW